MKTAAADEPSVDQAAFARFLGWTRRLEPWFDPLFVGMDRVPSAERPLLFVGNHTLGGSIDVPFLYRGLHEAKGIVLRGLGDRLHFQIPGWRDLVTRLGVVEGTRDNCAALMRAGQPILVFPGGAREVSKRRGEQYQLHWKQRVGFVRMAIAHGCTIVPFGSVGIEDAFDIWLDANDLLASPAGPLLRGLGVREDLLVPCLRGLGPTPVPRPERLYFGFGPPIPTRHLAGQADDEAACRSLREQVRGAVEEQIRGLRELQGRDAERPFRVRLRRRLLGIAG